MVMGRASVERRGGTLFSRLMGWTKTVPSHLVIRADAGTSMGTGHLMRCLAVAQEWIARGGTATLVTACAVPALLDRFAAHHIRVIRLPDAHPNDGDLATMQRVLDEHPGANVVLDGYHFDPGYQSAVASAGCRLAVIDDNAHLPQYFAHVIVNQNLHAPELAASYPRSSRLLLGPRYALLRREFRLQRTPFREHPGVARRILVSLGGSDPDNLTEKVLAALSAANIPGIEAVILLGPLNRYGREVGAAARQTPFPTRVERDSTRVAEWMSWAELAVSGAGSTTWELAYMGLPAVLVTVASNQRRLAEHLTAAGVARWIGDGSALSPQELADIVHSMCHDRHQRAEMGRRGRALVDGWGTVRVVDTLLSVA